MASPAYAHQDPPVKLRLHRPLLELKPLQEKYWEAQHLVKQMAVHEVGLCIQAILDKPLPMHWMHDLSIQMLGELLRLHPAIVTSEFGKVGMAQFCLPQKLNGFIRTVTSFVGSFLSHGQVKMNLSWLFPEHGDVDLAAVFVSKSPLDKRNYEPDHQE
jgi:hypothetical protein